MAKLGMKTCRNCGKEVVVRAEQCHYCQFDFAVTAGKTRVVAERRPPRRKGMSIFSVDVGWADLCIWNIKFITAYTAASLLIGLTIALPIWLVVAAYLARGW